MIEQKELTAKDLTALLPNETKEKFQIIDLKKASPKMYFSKHGEVDFNTLTVARAEQLLKQKASFIERVKANAKPATEK